MIFPRLKFLSTTTVPLPGVGWTLQSPSQGVSGAHQMRGKRAIIVATCSAFAVLMVTGWESLSRAEAANPRQVLSRPSQTVHQGSLHETFVLASNSTPVVLHETHDTQELEKTIASRGLNSALETQSANRSEADSEELVETSPKTIVPKNELNSQPQESLTSGPVSLPGADGWRVVAGPCLTVKDCEQELDREMMIATNRYIAEVLGRDDVGGRLQIDADFVRSHLLHEVTQSELVDTSYGKMRYLTALLRFDQAFSDELDSRWKNAQQKARVLQAGFGAGSILLLLVILLGYLKFDTVTGGHYSGRLQMATVGVILALVAVGAGISHWILWI